MPTAEIERHLDRVGNLLDESFGLDDGTRPAIILFQELKRRQYRLVLDSRRIPEPEPEYPTRP
jgi:hypothetical protein